MNNLNKIKKSSTDNSKQKCLSPRNRFRALIRRVIENGAWLCELYESKTHGSRFYLLRKAMKSQLTFNQRAVLMIPPEERNAEHISQINKIIDTFKCFRKYPDTVRALIADVVRYCYFGPDRVIVRENHYATGIFFVISGELMIVEEKYDAFLNETERIVIRKMVSGEPFGEISVAYDLPRTETIVSCTPVELFMISRESFELVLKDTVVAEWADISHLMSTFDYFKNCSKTAIGQCCLESTVKYFKKFDTVLGDGYGRKNFVYFVVKGSCDLIEDLFVEKIETRMGGTKYNLLDSPEERRRSVNPSVFSKGAYSFHNLRKTTSVSQRDSTTDEDQIETLNYLLSRGDISTVEIVFMKICTFRRKGCFSVGEPMSRRRIVANENLICLLIPFSILVGIDNLWLRVKQYILRSLPTTEAVFQKFVKQRKWRKYKAELVKPLLTTFRSNWICNIPYSIRAHEDFEFKTEETILTSTFQMKQKNRGTGSRAF